MHFTFSFRVFLRTVPVDLFRVFEWYRFENCTKIYVLKCWQIFRSKIKKTIEVKNYALLNKSVQNILYPIIISASSKKAFYDLQKSRVLIHYYTCVLHCFIDMNTKKMKLHQILFILSQFTLSCDFYYFFILNNAEK